MNGSKGKRPWITGGNDAGETLPHCPVLRVGVELARRFRIGIMVAQSTIEIRHHSLHFVIVQIISGAGGGQWTVESTLLPHSPPPA
mmetsp:Transcript_59207/g.69228  ORF Transcript_59207/g.69228 Transcript_59207/m.69228 type:complete len:86 (-) Transcript_59207:623-880(-)